MSKQIIDVLAPYEDEVLVSWIIRMLKMYCSKDFNEHTGEIMRHLFGLNTTDKPGMYLQKDLQYFIKNCGVDNAVCFSSVETMINKLSVVPFYFSFCTEEHKNKCLRKMETISNYLYLEKLIGIRNGHFFVEGNPYFKFCPECLKDSPEIYLRREHQIQGNLMCWKHGCVLRRIPYGLDWRKIDFVHKIKNNIGISEYELDEEQKEIAWKIAIIIHEVFENGFLDDINLLKTKLSSRLFEKGFLTKDGTFYESEKFLSELKVSYLYKDEILGDEIAAALCNGSFKNTNPLIYIILIVYAFGNLKEYYNYDISSIENTLLPKRRARYKIYKETLMHDIDYYKNNMANKFFDAYCILGDTETSIIIKHLPSNVNYMFSKKYSVEELRFNFDESKGQNHEISNQLPKVSYTRYLSTKEYGLINRKGLQQILYYCKENRLPGALKIGSCYWIPANTPYPQDKRYRNSIKFSEYSKTR